MNSDNRNMLIGCITIAVCAIVFFGFWVVVCLRVSWNDHANIKKDRDVKVACVQQADRQLIDGNCIPAVRS